MTRTVSALLLAVLIVNPAAAQRSKPKPATTAVAAVSAKAPKPLDIRYTLAFPQPQTHLYEVTMTVANVATGQLDLNLPVWTPGSYLVREYARNVQDFNVVDDAGQTLQWRKTDKSNWQIDAGASAAQPKTIRASYRVYANELATQTSHLDATHAYFNGATIFMYVPGAKDRPHRLKFLLDQNGPQRNWRVTSPLGLAPDDDGYFKAADYDRLIDAPTEVGTHKLMEFTAAGKPHRVAIWGDFNFDENRLKTDLQKIVEEDARMFGGLLYDQYVFIIGVQPGIGGGTEHLNANVSLTTPNAFKSERGYRSFLGLESHEYFHNWNVKRIRPVALGPFDYQHENYTTGLWVSEGITSYYGDLILRRAGLISTQEYLDDWARLLASYEQAPGRFQQSAETASFNAWIKHYRPDENSPNTAMSYYTKGQILGLLFDLEIRTRTNGAKSLDDVMRLLLANHGLPKPGFTDAELKAAFEQVAGADLTDFWKKYVSGVDEIDFVAYFAKAGLQLNKGYAPGTAYAQGKPDKADKMDKPGTLGIRTRAQDGRTTVANVLYGSPAFDGGLNTGDEIVAIDGRRMETAAATGAGGGGDPRAGATASGPLNELRAGQRVRLTIFRREKLMEIELVAAVKPFDRYALMPLKEMVEAQRNLYQAWLKTK